MKTSSIREVVGLKLTQLREEAGHTQREVASHLGVAYTTIGRWESGFTSLTVEHLAQLLDFYEINLIDFFKDLTCQKH